jgi:hypothetical protein
MEEKRGSTIGTDGNSCAVAYSLASSRGEEYPLLYFTLLCSFFVLFYYLILIIIHTFFNV